MNPTVAAAQYPITEHASFSDWKKHISGWVRDALKKKAQLLLFPEYGAMELVSIFPDEIRKDIRWQVQELNAVKFDFCDVFATLAHQYHITIVAPSIPVIEKDKRINRSYIFSEKGMVGYQDKFFMTRFENEDWGIQSAPKILTLFEASWGNFGIQLCYDIEFPLGAQILASAGASLILAPSCTETIRGATRVHIGARARALENQCYTAVSQTIGDAAWSPAVDINYGFSAFYCTPDKHMPEHGIISTMAPQTEGWLVQSLDFAKIEEVRKDGQVFNFNDLQHLKSGFLNDEVSLVRKSV